MDGQVKNSSGQMQLQRNNRQLKEQLIHGLNDEEMLEETIRELSNVMKTLTYIVKMF